MRNKIKKIVATCAAITLVLSVCYFAFLDPTTAWFYQAENKTYSFTFGDFDVDASTTMQTENMNFPLRAATRFADKGETLFDEVTYAVKFNVTNKGSLPAKVSVKVYNTSSDKVMDFRNTGGSNPNGLRWFVYSASGTLLSENDTTSYEYPEISNPTSTTAISKGVFKTAIESAMEAEESSTLSDYKDFADDAAYETYNTARTGTLQTLADTPIKLNGGNTSSDVYVVFWAEYGAVKGALEGSGRTTKSYPIRITLTAEPDISDMATLTITNNTSSAVQPTVTTGGSAFRGDYFIGDTKYTVTNANPTISIPAHGTIEIRGLTVGTYYRVTS
nr:hypothetical protein [Clostridiales bacterium]